MTGKEFKLLCESQELTEKCKPAIVEFLEKHREDSLIFDSVNNVRNWLTEIFPDLLDETEQDELEISAFIAGMMFVLCNSTSDTHIRWIYAVPPLEDDEEGDETDNE